MDKQKTGLNCGCANTLALLLKQGRGDDEAERHEILNELVTELLASDFNEDKVAHLADQLCAAGMDGAEVGGYMLSCMAFQEASSGDKGHETWERCKVKWIIACRRFEINEFSIREALRVGAEFRAPLAKLSPEDRAFAIYKRFFESVSAEEEEE
ncbi:MAG: hypothetical protein WCV50_04015 [Patescibacteria group bacterium]|jgi:hypothetical protein